MRFQGGLWRRRRPDEPERDTKDDRNMILKLRDARKKWWKKMPNVEEVEYEQMRGDLQYGQKNVWESIPYSEAVAAVEVLRARRSSVRGVCMGSGRSLLPVF